VVSLYTSISSSMLLQGKNPTTARADSQCSRRTFASISCASL
jgi:hypothetical protein